MWDLLSDKCYRVAGLNHNEKYAELYFLHFLTGKCVLGRHEIQHIQLKELGLLFFSQSHSCLEFHSAGKWASVKEHHYVDISQFTSKINIEINKTYSHIVTCHCIAPKESLFPHKETGTQKVFFVPNILHTTVYQLIYQLEEQNSFTYMEV